MHEGAAAPSAPVPAPLGMSDLDRLDALRLRAEAHPARFGALYADALRRMGRLDEAIHVIRATLEQGPRNVFGQGVLARCYRDVGHLEEAALVVRDALVLEATDPTLAELEYLLPFAPQRLEEDTPVHALAHVAEMGEPPERWSAAEVDRDPAEEVALPVPSAVAAVAPPPIFVTETMAELYVQQGLPGRALAIYRELTARAPGDGRLGARLVEVEALAAACAVEELVATEPAEEVPIDTEPAGDGPVVAQRVDALLDLPLLEDFDPAQIVEGDASAEVSHDLAVVSADEGPPVHWLEQVTAGPTRVRDEPASESAFDFSDDAHRSADPMPATGDAMLAGLSFDAIALSTPTPSGRELALPGGSGPSAREALRQLAGRSVTVRAGRRSPSSPPPRVVPPPSPDPLGDDFDQWLRGVS